MIDISELLTSIQESLPTVFYMFKNANVAIGLGLSLVMIAVLALIWVWLGQVVPVIRALNKLTGSIEQLSSASDFVKNFNKIDRLLLRTKGTKAGWTEYKKRLIFPEDLSSGKPIRSTVSPAYFINANYAEGRVLHLKFYGQFPDYLVGFGLILTFIGLVSALYFAALGLESGNATEARDSLTALLSAATFKFITSIAGISSSIFFSIVFHKINDALNAAFMNLNDVLSSYIFYASPESIGFGQYKELRRQSEKLIDIENNLIRNA